MKKYKLSLGCLALASLVGFASPSRAETVTATLTGLNPFAGADLTANGTTLGNGGVGELIWDGSGQGNSSPFTGNFVTFCIDLQEVIYFGNPYTFTLDPDISTAPKASAGSGSEFATGMGSTKASELEALFAAHYGSLDTTDFTSGDVATGSAAGDALQAFQLAIWAIVYDNSPSSTETVTDTSANFYESGVDTTAANLADSWLDAALTSSGPYQHNLQALLGGAIPGTLDFAQDQIVVNPNLGISTGLPVPSAALGGGILMVGLGLSRLRSFRRIPQI